MVRIGVAVQQGSTRQLHRSAEAVKEGRVVPSEKFGTHSAGQDMDPALHCRVSAAGGVGRTDPGRGRAPVHSNVAVELMRSAVPRPLAAVTALLLLVSMYLIFAWVPTEASMGIVQRIFYIHVSSAAVAFAGFFLGGFAAIGYLANRATARDDLSVACNEVGLLFACVNLITGCLWAKPVWGVYWAWDARLTTMLLLALIYAAYLILRESISEPGQRAVVCAVVSIFGMVDVPIVYMANRWWRTQHPAPVIGGGGSLDPRMLFVLLFTMFSLGMLYWCLVRQRRRLEALGKQADALRRQVQAMA